MATRSKTAKAAEKVPYHKGNVRTDLIDTALRLLQTERIEDISARRLCREINVSSANFYNHFDSLDHLLQEVAAVGFAKRAAENRRLMKKGLPRRDMLIQIAQNLVEFSISNSQLFRLMFGQLNDPAEKKYLSGSGESFRIISEIVMGKDIYRDDDLVFSHRECRPAYAYYSFIYGLARCISQGIIDVSGETAAERRNFVAGLTEQILCGIDPVT